MQPVYRIIGIRTVVVVREKVKGHWYYHARVGRRGEPGSGEPVKGSGSFSLESAKHHATAFAKKEMVERRRRRDILLRDASPGAPDDQPEAPIDEWSRWPSRRERELQLPADGRRVPRKIAAE